MVDNFKDFKSKNELNNEGILKEKLFEFFKDSKITVEDTLSRKGRNPNERLSEGNIKQCTINEYLSKYEDLLTFNSGTIDAKNIITELFLEKIIGLVEDKTRGNNSKIYYKYEIKNFDDLKYELYEIFDKETNKKLIISSPLCKNGHFCIKLEKPKDNNARETTENKIFIDKEKGGYAVFRQLGYLLSTIKFNYELDSLSFENSYLKIFNKEEYNENNKKYINIKNTFKTILLAIDNNKRSNKFENAKDFISILLDRNSSKKKESIKHIVTNNKPDIIDEINDFFNFIQQDYKDNNDFIQFFEQYIENLLDFVLYYRNLLSKENENIEKNFKKNGLKYDLISNSPVKRYFTYSKQVKHRKQIFDDDDQTISIGNLTGKQYELNQLPLFLITELSKYIDCWEYKNTNDNINIIDHINDIFKSFIDCLVDKYTGILENKDLSATKNEVKFLINTAILLINDVKNIKESKFKLFGINYKNCGTSVCENINKNIETLKNICNLIDDIVINKKVLDISDKDDNNNEYAIKLQKAAFNLTYNFYIKEATSKEIKHNAAAIKIFIKNNELFKSIEIKEELTYEELINFSHITKNLLSNIIRYLPNVKKGSNTEHNFKEFIAYNVNKINKQEMIELLQNKLIKPSKLFKYCDNDDQNKIIVEKFFINGNAGFIDNHDVLYDMLKNFDNSKNLKDSLKLYKIGDFNVKSVKNEETGFYKYNIEYKNKDMYNDTKVYDYLIKRVLGDKKYMDDLFDIHMQKESGISSGFGPDCGSTEKTDITKTEIIDNNSNKSQNDNNSIKFLKDYKKKSNKNIATSSLSYLFENNLKNNNEQEEIIKQAIKKKYEFKDNKNVNFDLIQDTIIENINFSDLPEEFLNKENYSKKIIVENNISPDNEWETLKLKEYPEIKIKISKTKFNNNDNELFNVVEIIENLRNEYDFIKAISSKYIVEFFDSKMNKKLDLFSEETYKDDRYVDFLFNKLEIEPSTIKSVYGIDAEKQIKKSITESNENTYKSLVEANNSMNINKNVHAIN